MNFRSIYLVFLAFFSSLFAEGFQMGFTSFLIPSMLMGFGIAMDVFIATIAKFRDESLSWKTWTLPVTATHVLFPAFGYYLFWGLAIAFPVSKVFLGLIGFILVALFIYEVICETAGKTPVFGITTWVGNLFGFKANDTHLLIIILAVSWDALWSGPAKAAQATAGGWTNVEVGLSFIIAGLVVALMAELALLSAFILRKIEFKNPISLSRFNFYGLFVELSVIGGFGILSLWNAFSNEVSLYTSIAISTTILAITFILIPSLRKNIRAEAVETVSVLGR